LYTCVRIHISGVECPSLNFSNIQLNTTAVSYQTYVNVSCQSGYQFNTSQSWFITYCQVDKSWSTLQTAECTRKLALFFNYTLYQENIHLVNADCTFCKAFFIVNKRINSK
jgi:Sushi repeat (SCR repeat)